MDNSTAPVKRLSRSPVPNLKFDKAGMPIFAIEDERVAYVEMMFASGFLPDHIKKVSDALACIDLLNAMGLPWPAFIGKTYVIGGKPAVMIEALSAAAHATGLVEYIRVEYINDRNEFMDRTNIVRFQAFGCVVTAKRKDQEFEQMVAYTMDDVKLANFTNPNYKKHPKDMLMWRAMGRALKQLWPLTCGGPLAQGINDGYEAVTDQFGLPVFAEGNAAVMQPKQGKFARVSAQSLTQKYTPRSEQDHGAKEEKSYSTGNEDKDGAEGSRPTDQKEGGRSHNQEDREPGAE